jgi:hypothetical protein
MNKKLFLTTILLAGFLFIKPENIFAACGTITSYSYGNFCTIDNQQLPIEDKAICSNSSTKCCTSKDECNDTETTKPINVSNTENICGKLSVNFSFGQQCNTNKGSLFSYTSCSGDTSVGSKCCNTQNACGVPTSNENSNQEDAESSAIQKTIIEGPDNSFFDSLNPLQTGEDALLAQSLSTPGGIVSRLLLFLFPLAGLILFAMLVWGGFEILSSSTQGTKGMEAGKNRITAAIVGFLLLFATYWMAQIIEVVFGIVIV